LLWLRRTCLSKTPPPFRYPAAVGISEPSWSSYVILLTQQRWTEPGKHRQCIQKAIRLSSRMAFLLWVSRAAKTDTHGRKPGRGAQSQRHARRLEDQPQSAEHGSRRRGAHGALGPGQRESRHHDRHGRHKPERSGLYSRPLILDRMYANASCLTQCRAVRCCCASRLVCDVSLPPQQMNA
jgi:hypothetical protein